MHSILEAIHLCKFFSYVYIYLWNNLKRIDRIDTGVMKAIFRNQSQLQQINWLKSREAQFNCFFLYNWQLLLNDLIIYRQDEFKYASTFSLDTAENATTQNAARELSQYMLIFMECPSTPEPLVFIFPKFYIVKSHQKNCAEFRHTSASYPKRNNDYIIIAIIEHYHCLELI